MNNTYKHTAFRQFTPPAEIDKALSTMQGLLYGMNLERKITRREMREFLLWFETDAYLLDRKPYREIIDYVEYSLSDGVITAEEIEDMRWMCERYTNDYCKDAADKIQQLQGALQGLLADGRLRDQEIIGLRDWMRQNFEIAGSWPFDELYDLLSRILQDNRIDEEEQLELRAFLQQFVVQYNDLDTDQQIREEVKNGVIEYGLCASDPSITFSGQVFCLTGISSRASRSEIINLIRDHGGTYSNGVTKNVNYLMVGDSSNSSWSYSCYGRKVEKAIRYRQEGTPIAIVREHDFWNAAVGAWLA